MNIRDILKIAYKGAVHYKRTGLLVALALAVAGAVTTGSLVIGDSVEGSIRHSALARLGLATHALKISGFARSELAEDLPQKAVAMISASGIVENQESGQASPAVSVYGVASGFSSFYPGSGFPELLAGQAAVNEALAKDLGAGVGDAVLVTVDKKALLQVDNLFAHVDPVHNQGSLRLEIVKVLPDVGPGGFRLDSSTQIPRNIFVSLPELSKAMSKDNKCNLILAQTDSAKALEDSIRQNSQLADYGIEVRKAKNSDNLIVTADSMTFSKAGLSAVLGAAKGRATKTSVYLAQSLKTAQGTSYYSTVASIDPAVGFELLSGKPIDSPDQIILNTWIAEDLKASAGEKLTLTYLKATGAGEYSQEQLQLTVQGIAKIAGTAADSEIIPKFEGITDADRIGDWQPPFPVDLKKVKPRDDLYWENYKALPKAYLHPDTLKKLWNTEISTTAVLVPVDRNVSEAEQNFSRDAMERISALPGVVLALREQAYEASKGNTDLSSVFFGLGLLLIYASSAMAGSFIRISALSRARQLGILVAQGFTARQAALTVFWEWMLWIGIGSLLALPLGLLYGWGVSQALNSWWRGAVGSSVLWLHWSTGSLVLGAVSTALIGTAVLLISISGISNRNAVDLLADREDDLSGEVSTDRSSTRALRVLLGLAAVAVIVSIFRPIIGLILALPLAVPVGILSAQQLISYIRGRYPLLRRYTVMLTGSDRWLRHDAAVQLAAAAVILIVVSSQVRSNFDVDKQNGTGGFSLRLAASLPLGYDLSTADGRAKLGFQPEDEKVFASTRIYAMPASDGDDISCLNLARPSQPRILGLSEELMRRGGFGLGADIWDKMLSEDRIIPALGDSDSLEWNLKKKTGQKVEITGQDGNPASLEIVGMIPRSIFAGELLIPQRHFSRVFPNAQRARFYLVETSRENADRLAGLLRTTLGSSGLEVRNTTEIVGSYMAMQNTYIAVLMALGALALILGSGGQVIGVFRSISGHRSRYALLLSIGFSSRDIAYMLIFEHAVVPSITVVLSCLVCAIIMLPGWISGAFSANWTWPLIVLPAMAVVGITTCALAARKAASENLIQALRSE